MRGIYLYLAIVLAALPSLGQQQNASSASTQSKGYTLTVIVDGVDDRDGNIGVLVFNSSKGWAEDRTVALRDIVVPAHPGTVNVVIPDLPAGEYALSIAHDVNKNHKLDRNWMGKPTEQWGISNDPHAVIKTPSYNAAKFTLKQDQEIHVKMQQ
jgi:uncharacterized protein (DUF2141 family)